ncbi:sensor histidine kinase [Amycolatopsis roodepoortensis]|uniref:histidine kinase n=1 Tax=Amycolatopsis roodepoortensis TaxID=700274 RepID=A0ABR9LLY5_9PSEU|nr:histidine kinase [Amycolatopsis roodepoortensis]MBE1581248.1 signal transduction histidine kinase [Amycolatopsis roodepoortensis]
MDSYGGSLGWALLTGRDADLEPPSAWWRGPVWVKTLLAGSALAVLVGLTYGTWARYLGGNSLPLVFFLLILQVVPPLLVVKRPLTAVRVAAAGMVCAIIAVLFPARPTLFGPTLSDWPLQVHVLPYLPVLAMTLARTKPGQGRGISIIAVTLAVGVGVAQLPRAGTKTLVWSLIVVAATIAAGYGMQQRRRALEQVDAAERTTVEERAKRASLQERALIARELHDIIGHHLSLIALRTDSARYRVPDVSEAAEEEFRAIGVAAREALDEARRLVGVLRDTEAEPEHEPQPGLAEVPSLIDGCRASGIGIRAKISACDDVPALIELAAYRILQEALSNAARHSPGAEVEVEVRRGPDGLEILVENGPPTRPAAPSAGDGTGLAGIAERVTLIGGSHEAGPRADGGFRVAVKLDLPGVDDA